MKRSTVNLAVDALAFTAFLLLTASGVLVRYVLPPGSGRFASVWGLDRHDWGEIHFWIAVLMLAALSFHFFLHWRWIVCMVQGRPRQGSGFRVALALIGLVALLAIAAAPFLVPVEKTGVPPQRQGPAGTQPGGGHDVTGSMTLREVEERTGVPAAAILGELGLPPDVPVDERLGRLGRTYGFDMGDVRRILSRRGAGQERGR
ncbi:MAG: DUF4405 domain-containing protein [bacterium]